MRGRANTKPNKQDDGRLSYGAVKSLFLTKKIRYIERVVNIANVEIPSNLFFIGDRLTPGTVPGLYGIPLRRRAEIILVVRVLVLFDHIFI